MTQRQTVSTTGIDRFTFGSLIGEGGLSTVFAAVDPIDDRPVALKVVRPELVAVPTAAQRFQREFDFLRQVTSSYAITAYEHIAADDGRSALVLERATESLSDRMGRLRTTAPMRHKTALQLVDQLSAALSVVHQEQLVFADVGPRNLLIVGDSPGAPLAVDGELIGRHERIAIADPSIEITAAETGTAPWQEFGTPRFAAPEQRDGTRPMTAAVDIYSATATLWFVLFGQPPHRLTPQTVGSLSGTVRLFFETGMHQDPTVRFPDIRTWKTEAHVMLATLSNNGD